MITAIAFAALVHMPVTAPFETAMLDLSVGDKFTYKTTTKSETDSPMGAFSSTVIEVKTFEVVSATGSWFKIKSTTDEYDFESDAPSVMGEESKKGLVTSFDVSPVRKMQAWKLDSAGELSDAAEDIMRGNKKSIEMNGFQNLIMPEGELKVGMSWKHEARPLSESMGGMDAIADGKLSVEFSVLEFTGAGAERTVVIKAEVSGDFQMLLSSDQFELEMDVSVEETAKYWVRLSDGVVTRIELESESEMSSDFGEMSTTTEVKVVLSKD